MPFIPLVSSSPPPLDESAAHPDDVSDDDDFGGFASALPAPPPVVLDSVHMDVSSTTAQHFSGFSAPTAVSNLSHHARGFFQPIHVVDSHTPLMGGNLTTDESGSSFHASSSESLTTVQPAEQTFNSPDDAVTESSVPQFYVRLEDLQSRTETDTVENSSLEISQVTNDETGEDVMPGSVVPTFRGYAHLPHTGSDATVSMALSSSATSQDVQHKDSSTMRIDKNLAHTSKEEPVVDCTRFRAFDCDLSSVDFDVKDVEETQKIDSPIPVLGRSEGEDSSDGPGFDYNAEFSSANKEQTNTNLERIETLHSSMEESLGETQSVAHTDNDPKCRNFKEMLPKSEIVIGLNQEQEREDEEEDEKFYGDRKILSYDANDDLDFDFNSCRGVEAFDNADDDGDRFKKAENDINLPNPDAVGETESDEFGNFDEFYAHDGDDKNIVHHSVTSVETADGQQQSVNDTLNPLSSIIDPHESPDDLKVHLEEEESEGEFEAFKEYGDVRKAGEGQEGEGGDEEEEFEAFKEHSDSSTQPIKDTRTFDIALQRVSGNNNLPDPVSSKNLSQDLSTPSEQSDGFKAGIAISVEQANSRPQSDDDDDFDDFAKFQGSCIPVVVDDKPAVAADENWSVFGGNQNQAEDDWASFKETLPLANEPVTVIGLGDKLKDNLSTTHGIGTGTPAVTHPHQAILTLKLNADSAVLSALETCFNARQAAESVDDIQSLCQSISLVEQRTRNNSNATSVPLTNILPSTSSRATMTKDVTQQTTDVNVWNCLRVMEDTAALKFNWTGSTVSQKLLKSINIDTRNILVGAKRSVPIFATNLGLLEPKSSADQQQQRTTTSSSGSRPAADMSAAAVDSSNQHHTEIPAAQFDWTSSGLINPLDAASTSQLDLDFFVNSTRMSSGLQTLVSEASEKEKELLESLEPTSQHDASTSRRHAGLESILASMSSVQSSVSRGGGVGGKRRVEDESRKISEEALSILNALPDLSFMSSKVLMFPIKGEA